MNHDEIKDSISAYCLGALDETEQSSIEEHLKQGCSECEALLGEMQEVVNGLAFAAPAQKPSALVKEKILAAIEPQKTPAAAPLTQLKEKVEDATVELLQRARERWMRVSWGLSLAIAVILVLLGLYSQNLKTEITFLEKRLEVSDQVVSQLRIELARQERILKVVQAPEVRIVDLQGQKSAPDATGRVLWDPSQKQAVFSALNLPAAPSDKDYQLWMLRGTQPVDAGIFSLDAEGNAIFTIETIADSINLTAFAVTLEPKGGVPQPTGDFYLVGAVIRG
ncbi:anti-sigma factor [candidate division KSB1 bacterium]|nr:anti-sigma factor [candidate division KSB1 bacterium]